MITGFLRPASEEELIGTVDQEAVNEMRKEIRAELKSLTTKELLLEAAVNSRVAVRVLYRGVVPRVNRLERNQSILFGVCGILALLIPGIIAFFELVLR